MGINIQTIILFDSAEEENEAGGTKFNLTACIFGIIGVVAFISLIIACNKGCKNDDAPPEPTDAVYERNAGGIGNLKIRVKFESQKFPKKRSEVNDESIVKKTETVKTEKNESRSQKVTKNLNMSDN